MAKKLYLGNLPYTATEIEIKQAFSECGEVFKVQIVMDRVSGRSKGFAFVDMASDEGAKAAIEKFHEASYAGKPMLVTEAKASQTQSGSSDRPQRPKTQRRPPNKRTQNEPNPGTNQGPKFVIKPILATDDTVTSNTGSVPAAQSEPQALDESRTS